MLFLYLFILIFGLVIGSFLNCVIYRLEEKKSFLKGRSFCPNCKHPLTWKDLIPVFSFLILQGKCRYCDKKISIQYPLVEISTGLIFLLIFNYQFSAFQFYSFKYQFLFSIFYLLIISSFLIIIFVYDLKHYIIPDEIIWPAIIITGVYNLQFSISNGFLIFSLRNFFIYPLLAGIGAASFFFLIWFFSRGKWIGFGDVKLAFLMGLILGFPKIILAIFFSSFIGAIIGVGLVILKKKDLKSEIPFGPFLVSGTFIAIFWGQQIIDFYFRLIDLTFL